MRVAMVSEHASPLAALGGADAGGQNVHVAEVAAGLVRRGHEVTVYTRRDDPTLPDRVEASSHVGVVHVPAGPPRALPKDDLLPHIPAFGRWLGAHLAVGPPPDVVHSHFWMSGLAALAADCGAPVVHTYHALGSVKRRHQGMRDTSPAGRIEAEARIGRQVDLVVATCRDEVRELGRLGIARDRVRVVPCGVDLHLFTPDGDRAPRPPGLHRLLSLGRLVERKGVDTVVRALVRLPATELVVAGGPADLAADPEAQRLRSLADQLGVGERVHLLGPVPRAAVPALVRSADVVVATPWYEPFGIVPLEAAACGRPVVGSAVGGLLDSVADRRTGLLVPPRDPEALASAVLELLADPRLRQRYGREARRRAGELFGWDQVARRTEQAYRSIRRRGHARRRTTGATA